MSPPETKLQTVQWFPPLGGQEQEGGLVGSLVKLGVSGLVGGFFYYTHHPIAAYVVWGLGVAVGVPSLVSPAARRAIDGALASLGRGVASVLGSVILGAVYLLVITPLRYIRRAAGADDLGLRDPPGPSHWLACDDDARKVRWAGAMFATERASQHGGHPLRTTILVVAALVVMVELVLRGLGFGHTVLYIADPEIGYYPQPNVSLRRYGGQVSTNQFGMRSPPVSREKPAGTFRVLMLGDSTLWGGSYIDQEEMYATLVRKGLNAKGLPGPVEVLVMGVNGWGPYHEHGFVRVFGTMDADLTIVNLPIDDVTRPLYGLASVPFFAVQSPPKLAMEEVANHLMWRYRSEHAGIDPKWEQRQARHGINEYGLLADDLMKAGSEVMFFVLPGRDPGFGKPQLKHYWMWRKELEGELKKRGVKSFFPRGLFRGQGEPDAIYHDYVHLNTPGHRIYAEFMQAKIAEESARLRAFKAGTQAAANPAAPGTATSDPAPPAPATAAPSAPATAAPAPSAPATAAPNPAKDGK
jgi:hypothetical protein